MVDVRRFYERRLRKYGDGPQVLGWSAEGQRRRFEILEQVGIVEGAQVLDVGCGLGHFLDYLQKERSLNVSYRGLDLSLKLIERARKLHPKIPFEVANVFSDPLPGPSDFVVASGVLNLEMGNNEAVLRRFLHSTFAGCRNAVAVNMLSTSADWYDRGRHYYDPIRTMRHARTVTRRVVLRHDYLPHDFTLYLYREPSSGQREGMKRLGPFRPPSQASAKRVSGANRGTKSRPGAVFGTQTDKRGRSIRSM